MYLIFIKKKDILGEGKRIIMKLYVVISDDYDEEWGAEIYLHGIFDNYEKAKSIDEFFDAE